MGSQFRGPMRIPLEEREAMLIKQWKEIEALDSNDDSVSEAEFGRQKEAWFGHAFSFLRDLPQEEHCWCKHSDVVWPLLEPFHNYFTACERNSHLNILWKRLSLELNKCTQCVLQHHKAKEIYASDFHEEVVSTLLAALQTLDEERVARHLNDILYKMRNNNMDAEKDSEELICVLFEVLMFPTLLNDAEIDLAFVPFLQYIENTHELTLAGDQHYPGVYALLFHTDQSTRGCALRLAASFGKLRTGADLEPIQSFLQKHMHCLEFDLFDQRKLHNSKGNIAKDLLFLKEPASVGGHLEASRPRAFFTRESIWMGLKTLLGLLKPSAFEEGIVERYPSFLSIVLNHASEVTPVFWNALHCLKLLLEVLGYKIWIKTTFSPGVVRSTLIGQCFHTREEKMHKAVFDLFQPFLQSLEALQDGEHERQRRNILYFLLQQVAHSSNFSGLMSKKARQVSFLIILRGFKMNPACPPLECAHVWGPVLVESVKDTQLYHSVRQPAVSLLETIIIADSVVLAHLNARGFKNNINLPDDHFDVDEEICDNLPADSDIEMIKSSHLKEYKNLDKLAKESDSWSCVPLLWVDILEKILPSEVPESFSQALIWALSRMSAVSQSNRADIYPECLYSKEITSSLKWVTPKGCDDGADGKLCANSLKAQLHGSHLICLLKRCAYIFTYHLQSCTVVQNWTWDPLLAEALILLFLDSNEKMRDISRYIISCFNKDSSLDSGLKFLCSCQPSIACVKSGLLYATKLFMVNSLPEALPCLQNLLFIAWKFFTLGQLGLQEIHGISNASQPSPACENEGGFLKQPEYDSQSYKGNILVSEETCQAMTKKLCQQLSTFLSPLLLKLLKDGRHLSEDNAHLMAFARTFDLLPLVFQNIKPALEKRLSSKGTWQSGRHCLQDSPFVNSTIWLFHFIGWGEVNAASIHRRWKAALVSILNNLKDWHWLPELKLTKEVVDWLDRGTLLNNEMKVKLETLLQMSLKGAMDDSNFINLELEPSSDATAGLDRKLDVIRIGDQDLLQVDKEDCSVIELSDDETEVVFDHPKDLDSLSGLPENLFIRETSSQEDREVEVKSFEELSKVNETHAIASQRPTHKHPVSMQKQLGVFVRGHGRNATIDKYFDSSKNNPTEDSEASYGSIQEKASVLNVRSTIVHSKSIGSSGSLKAESETGIKSKPQETAQLKEPPGKIVDCLVSAEVSSSGQMDQDSVSSNCKVREGSDAAVLKELVSDPLDDFFETNTSFIKSQQALPRKSVVIHPKRQLIRLRVPNEHFKISTKRFSPATKLSPPRLDEWYRRILSLDYFSVVGASSDMNPENVHIEPMIKVPKTFQSCEHYMDVFRPLVLEEFKAQLQHTYDQLTISDGMTTGVLWLMSLEKVDDFEFGRFMTEAGADGAARACFENDLLLLSRQQFQKAAQSAHLLGQVERREKDSKSKSVILILKFFLRSGSKRLAKVRSLLIDRSKWHMTRLMSIKPQLREFQALSSLENLPLLPIILNNGTCKLGSLSDQQQASKQRMSSLNGLPENLQHQLRSNYNESQLQAICAALKSAVGANGHELSLVQGPPGTGKTGTIVGIVSALIASFGIPKGASTKEDYNSRQMPNSSANRSVNLSVAIARSWQAAALAKYQMQEEIKERPEVLPIEKTKRARILVCAQSNAAVDELVSRMCKEGLYDLNGGFFKPYLIRVGNVKTVHPKSLPVFIDTLVEKHMESEKENCHNGTGEKAAAQMLRMKLDKTLEKIQDHEGQLLKFQDSYGLGEQTDTGDPAGYEPSSSGVEEQSQLRSTEGKKVTMDETALRVKLNMLYRQRRQLCGELAMAVAEDKKSMDEDRAKRQSLKRDIIRQAEVVVATLSGCGGDVYSACMESTGGTKQIKCLGDGLFDAVVIDEAAQALEPATLIPLQLLKRPHAKCIMVGDPKQLPATVLSQLASRFSYECSMFERLQQGGFPVTVLDVQYRMHPEICQFPSMHFYDKQLQDGTPVKDGSRHATFHNYKHFGPYLVFDVVEGFERVRHRSMSQSLCNEAEVEVAFEVFRGLKIRLNGIPHDFLFGQCYFLGNQTGKHLLSFLWS